ncbi:hypothetical protein PVL29_009561 [Vitis rotundifolia]|uniref:Uncharacterized protein n=1 Tax=Vitis rotundifolia TaxID=103349 RepID=A0AA38ZRI4_VITRO|nr:hypothetical protein PVL29_009561 [Vitis rotundifolia]
MNHQTLQIPRNLLAVIQEPQLYMLPIIPRRLSKVVVPGEHHVLKDLPFYEEAHELDTKARQEHLDQREEKRQEGKLRKALGEKGQPSPSSSADSSPAKKKKPSTKAIKVLALVLASSSVSTPSTPTSSRSDLNPQSSKSELVIPDFLYESEMEEEMVIDLRAGFRDRQNKLLFKPIEVVSPPAKRSCPEEVHEEPIMDPSMTPVPHFDVVGSSSVPVAMSPIRVETCPT